MKNHALVESYIPLVGFLAEALGNNYEVVLHDMSGGEDRILAIHNSHVSGRGVCENEQEISQNPYLLEYLLQNQHRQYIVNYAGKTAKGRKLSSSTFFIKEEGVLVGFICINCDITLYEQARDALDRIVMQPRENILLKRDKNKDDDVEDIRSIVNHIITETISGLDVAAMDVNEKKYVVEQLQEQGVFLFKGSMPDVASKLGISQQTLYRYIKEIS